MEFRYRLIDGVPPSQVYSTAPFPPPPVYYDYYFPPSFDATYAPVPPLSNHGSSASHAFRARMPFYRSRSEELPTGHNLFHPYPSRRDPVLQREYERERIREEVLREEVLRRILKEEVRWELEMERSYGLNRPTLGYHATGPAVQFEQPRYSGGCYTRRSRGQVKRNCFKSRYWVREAPKRWVREIPHKIVEINEEELMSKPPASKDKVKPPNEEEIQKKMDKQVQAEENGNKVERDVGEIAHKIMEVTDGKVTPPQALLKDNAQSPKNQEELRTTAPLLEQAMRKDMTKLPPSENNIGKKDGNKVLKPDNLQSPKNQQDLRPTAPLLEQAMPKDMTKPPPSENNIGKEDGNKILKPDNGNKVEQIAFSESRKELLKEAEACGSKRKGDKVGLRKAKKQKTYKEYSCTLCHVTVKGDGTWLSHLNGKRHGRMLKSLVDKNVMMKNRWIRQEEVMDKTSTPGVELAAVKVEMDKADSSLVAEQTSGVLQMDKPIIKKMQVGHEVHEVVEKNSRLWCERCQYNCTTTVMMTIHLVSEKHKANCQKH